MLKKIGKRWALVSVKDPSKILKWFGKNKPSLIKLTREEKRVQYYKNLEKHNRDK
jgi:hypothetical protein